MEHEHPSHPLTADEVSSILTTLLNRFREIDPDITALRILALLNVMKNPGMQQYDMDKMLGGLSSSAVSRNVVDWTDTTTGRKVGPGFIEQRVDPMYRKRNLLWPTAKGHQFIASLADLANRALRRK